MVATRSGQCPQQPPVTDSGQSALRGEDEGLTFEFLEFPHLCAMGVPSPGYVSSLRYDTDPLNKMVISDSAFSGTGDGWRLCSHISDSTYVQHR